MNSSVWAIWAAHVSNEEISKQFWGWFFQLLGGNAFDLKNLKKGNESFFFEIDIFDMLLLKF